MKALTNEDIGEMLTGIHPAIGLFPRVQIDPEDLAALCLEVLRLRAVLKGAQV